MKVLISPQAPYRTGDQEHKSGLGLTKYPPTKYSAENSSRSTYTMNWLSFGVASAGDDPELPPGSPPTSEYQSFIPCGAHCQSKSNLKDHGLRPKYHSPQQSEFSLSFSFPIAVQDGLCFSLPEQSSKVRSSEPHSPKTCDFCAIAFSPHEAHAHQAFFGWVLPTIRTSEFTVLQIVGLDAAVVCSKLSHPQLIQD